MSRRATMLNACFPHICRTSCEGIVTKLGAALLCDAQHLFVERRVFERLGVATGAARRRRDALLLGRRRAHALKDAFGPLLDAKIKHVRVTHRDYDIESDLSIRKISLQSLCRPVTGPSYTVTALASLSPTTTMRQSVS